MNTVYTVIMDNAEEEHVTASSQTEAREIALHILEEEDPMDQISIYEIVDSKQTEEEFYAQ